MAILLSEEVKCQMNNCSLIGTVTLDFIKLGLHHRKIPKVDFLQNKTYMFPCATKVMHAHYRTPMTHLKIKITYSPLLPVLPC